MLFSLSRTIVRTVFIGNSPGKEVEFRRRPEPVYDPFAPDDACKTNHRVQVVEVSAIPYLHSSRSTDARSSCLYVLGFDGLWMKSLYGFLLRILVVASLGGAQTMQMGAWGSPS